MFDTIKNMSSAADQGSEAAAKMNTIADNLLLARDICVYGMAFYASYTLLKKYFVKPFMSTYRFLSNQCLDMKGRV